MNLCQVGDGNLCILDVKVRLRVLVQQHTHKYTLEREAKRVISDFSSEALICPDLLARLAVIAYYLGPSHGWYWS